MTFIKFKIKNQVCAQKEHKHKLILFFLFFFFTENEDERSIWKTVGYMFHVIRFKS